MTAAVRHPARYSRQLLPTLQAWLADVEGPILDPFAGVGASGIPGLIHNELEPEWAAQCPRPVVVGDALRLPFRTGSVAAVVTSPTYGNRMADHHTPKDACRRCDGSGAEEDGQVCRWCRGSGQSPRKTYRHNLGRKLTRGNSGAMQWGPKYREFHSATWAEVRRVLRPGGLFVLNIKDHIRNGERQHVSRWHQETTLQLGFRRTGAERVPCPSNRFGANGAARIDHEMLYRFIRP